MTTIATSSWRVLAGATAVVVLSATLAAAKDFTFDAKVNAEMATRLNIPVYFAVPARAYAALPKTLNVSDALIDFRHPDAKGSRARIGLRIVLTKRAGLSARLGSSGLVQTGDILLSFRPEWRGAGAYPSSQMGVSHSGIAYIKDGALHNLDNPMDADYLGAELKGDLTGEHYGELTHIHIIRPRNLSEAGRARLSDWIARLAANPKEVYPSQISFNKDYNAPKFKSGQPLDFVKHLGQVALGQKPPGNLAMYCSEFVWSVLSLRDCDPATTPTDFQGASVPACVKPPMQPMQATGDYMTGVGGPSSYAGLADGPLMVIDAMKLPDAQEDAILHTVFVEDPANKANLSSGHKALAEALEPLYAPFEAYYLGVTGKRRATAEARLISRAFNKGAVPENYSPTSFLINAMLPANNRNRTMDYVATLVIE
jgi:hypothetical protein